MTRPARSLGDLLDEEVLPALFQRLDQAFPEFGWEPTKDGWVATNRETTKRLLDARPDRVVCHRPHGFLVHGGAATAWTAYVNGGQPPRGDAFVQVVRRLCELAGVAFPEREATPAELEAAADAEQRRRALAAALPALERLLQEPAGATAREYLVSRGLDAAGQAALGVGFLPDVPSLRRALPAELRDAAKEAGLLWDRLEGYALFPWLDAWGRPLTLYGRWPGKTPPEGRPKTIALPGQGTKSSPFCFDRARAVGHVDVVLVEGVLDAAVLQARGDARVVACVGAQLARAQVETLARHRVRSVTICLDPDGAGDKGTLACVRDLEAAGVASYVAPRLPDGLDPDELVLRDGLAAWRAHVGRAVSGVEFQAEQLVAGVTPESPRVERDRALEAAAELLRRLQGPQAVRQRDEIVRRLAAATGVRAAALEKALPRHGAKAKAGGPDAPTAPAGAPEAPSANRGAGVPTARPGESYREDGHGIVLVREQTNEHGQVQRIEERLCNFTARITAEVVLDDGVEPRRLFEVTGKVGPRQRALQVPASEFAGLGWTVELGAEAILEPGPAVKDRVRHAVQVLSGRVPERAVHAHLGWGALGGRRVYFHAGGAIGADGPVEDVRVRLEEPFDRFCLPDPPEGSELQEAVRASLAILDAAPLAISLPAFAAVWRAPLGPCDFSLYLVGSTGVLKTSFTAVVQQHWGAALHHANLPGSWESSGNALEGLLSVAKDALFTIDDFVPTGSSQDRAKKHKEADRVLRGQANGTGRQRMRPDASLRPTRRSRGLVVATGEELPRGESLHARLLVVPVGPGDVDAARLAACQKDGAAGRYAQALAGYLRWLAGKPDPATKLQAEVAALRATFVGDGQHRRTPEIAANLFLGLRAFHRFAEEVGVYDAATSAALLDARKAALLDAIGLQQLVHADSNPVRRFFELLETALGSGRAHVAGPDGRVPTQHPLAWGWRLESEGRAEREDAWYATERTEASYVALGERIGWVDEDALYLDPDASHAVAHKAAGDEGFPLSPRALRRRLREHGHLRSAPATRTSVCTRVTLGGVVRSVLHLGADALWRGDGERGGE